MSETTTPVQSGSASNYYEGVLHTFQINRNVVSASDAVIFISKTCNFFF